jgi:hypothetical protein
VAAQLVFRDARRPGVEHVFGAGASGYAEAAVAWRDGRRWLDSATGTFLRDRPKSSGRTSRGTPARQPAARDYLADWRL